MLEYIHMVERFVLNSQSSTSYVDTNRFVIKRAEVNTVIKILQIMTVASIGG